MKTLVTHILHRAYWTSQGNQYLQFNLEQHGLPPSRKSGSASTAAWRTDQNFNFPAAAKGNPQSSSVKVSKMC